MKNSFKAAIIFLVLLTTSVNAQTSKNTDKLNYIVSTSKTAQLQPIIATAEALAKEDAEKFGEFQAIIYGKTVQELTDKEAMKKFIVMAKNANVRLLVCNMALKTFEVNPADIPDEFEVVDNAFTHILQMQKQGYLSIQL
ncbi:MAG: DsrE family protein [Gillisia sp.]